MTLVRFSSIVTFALHIVMIKAGNLDYCLTQGRARLIGTLAEVPLLPYGSRPAVKSQIGCSLANPVFHDPNTRTLSNNCQAPSEFSED